MIPSYSVRVSVALAALVATASQAYALPLGRAGDGAARSLAPSAEHLRALDVDFTAIVALSNCSGSLVRFANSQATDQALVLTNGHCFEGGFIDPGEVLVDRPSNRSFRLLTSDGQATLATLRAQRVVYATMTDTDVTLYRLTQTYAEIEAQTNVQALTILDRRPDAGTPIRIVSGYWRRIYSCSIDDFVFQLREGDWTFADSIRYSQPGCETIGGTSGSPIINADTHEVVGINNTGNEDGGRCTLNNPCEVDEAGAVVVRRDAAYGQQLFRFYGCLDDGNNLDLTLPGCELPKP